MASDKHGRSGNNWSDRPLASAFALILVVSWLIIFFSALILQSRRESAPKHDTPASQQLIGPGLKLVSHTHHGECPQDPVSHQQERIASNLPPQEKPPRLPRRLSLYAPTNLLHHPALRAADFALLLVHHDLEDSGKTDEDVDDHREAHAAKYHLDKIVAKGYQKPVETTDDKKDERYHVKDFHRERKNG